MPPRLLLQMLLLERATSWIAPAARNGSPALACLRASLTPGLQLMHVRERGIKTLVHFSQYEQVIKKSRFIACAAPVTSSDAANEFVKERSDPKARHNCFAWRLASGDTRTHGDGEPGGTAGPPILAAIAGADLHDVVVLVSRYRLGAGAKLGTGGLVRAYGGTAAECLSQAETKNVEPKVPAIVRFFAEDTGAVFGIVGSLDPETVVLPTEPPETILKFEIASEEVDGLREELNTATNGRVSCVLLADDEDEDE